jgi:hypothetical protein
MNEEVYSKISNLTESTQLDDGGAGDLTLVCLPLARLHVTLRSKRVKTHIQGKSGDDTQVGHKETK